MQLERRIKTSSDNKLPKTLFFQIDGGSENANVYLIAICELLVSKRLTSKIYLTRLPVGHTHEDIDSKFGYIWKKLRSVAIISPQEQERKLREIFSSSKLKFDLVDVKIVPDYKLLLESSIDPHFAGYVTELIIII
jgi:hypothetical protein